MPQNTSPTLILSNVESAQTTLSKAKNLLSQKNYEQAIPLLKKAIEVFEVGEAWEAFMEASCDLGFVYCEEFEFLLSMQIIDYALKTHEERCLRFFIWKVKLHIQKSKVLRLEGRLNELLECLLLAQQIMERECISGELFIYVLLLQVLPNLSMSRYAQVEQLIKNASKMLDKEKHTTDDLIAELHYSKAVLEYSQAKYQLAQQDFQKAYELYSSQNMHKKILSYCRVGAVYGVLGDRKREFAYYLKMEAVYKDSDDKQAKFQLARIYIMMGVAIQYTGEAYQATQSWYYFETSLRLLEELSDKLRQLISVTLLNLGVLMHKEGKYNQAIEYNKKNLRLRLKIYPKKSMSIASSYMILAYSYENLGEIDKALKYLQKSLNIYIEKNDNDADEKAECYLRMGVLLPSKNKHSKALRMLSKALKCYKKIYGNVHFRVGMVYREMGKIRSFQGKLKKSLEYYQLALIAFLPNYEASDVYHFPNIDQCVFTTPEPLYNTLFLKARTFFDYFKVLEQKQSPKAAEALKASLKGCRLIADYRHQIQQRLKTEGSKLHFANRFPSFYELSIRVSLCLANQIGDPSMVEEAFIFQENEKSYLLQSSIQENEAKIKASIPSNLLQQEKDLREQIQTYLQKIQQEEARGEKKNEIELKKWKQKHFHAFQKHQKLIVQLEKDYPQYYALKYNFETISVTILQKDLQENTVVLSYFIGPEMGYIFVVTPDEYQVIPFEVPADFDQQIKEYLSSIHAQNFATFTHQSYDLYCLLIKPIEDLIFDPFAQELRQLVILPSASLHYLPFETLISRPPETAIPAFHQLDYLLNKFQIQYHYSATLYHQSLKQGMENTASLNAPSKEDGIDFMGFAPIYTSDKEATQEALRNLASDYSRWATRSDALQDGTLAPLPFSEKEVQSIEALFAKKGLNGQSFLYDTATKEHFKTLATKAKYLHIAAHGLTNDEFPKLSGIVFHPTEDAAEIHDSVLSMGEMYQLQLQADLVVLSSCESGIGTLAKGEGMMAMNRGFLHAGAKNVIYTLFKVLDKPSSELCEALFEGILEGKSYGEALRQAKLSLIQREDVDPKSWSGFVLLGV